MTSIIRISRCVAIACLVALTTAAVRIEAAPAWVLIVNEANPVTELQRPKVAAMFLRKTLVWPSGAQVLPAEARSDTPLRTAFTRDVIKRSNSALQAYWQQQIFSGGTVPPPRRDSDALMLTYVKANPGAIGYISADAPTGGVRVVTVID